MRAANEAAEKVNSQVVLGKASSYKLSISVTANVERYPGQLTASLRNI